MPVFPFQVGDNLMLKLNLFNLQGMVDFESFEFKAPVIEKYVACENKLEKQYTDWTRFEYF